MKKLRSVSSGHDINPDECVISLMHKAKLSSQKHVNEQHAYIIMEQFSDNKRVTFSKFDLVLDYDVQYIIVGNNDYNLAIQELRGSANEWAEEGLAVHIVIDKDSDRSHFLSAKTDILYDVAVDKIGHDNVKDAAIKLVEHCRAKNPQGRYKLRQALGDVYMTYYGHYFSATARLNTKECSYYEANSKYDELLGESVMNGKSFVLPAGAAKQVNNLMEHSVDKKFDYNMLGKSSIFSKVVDATLESCQTQTQSCHDGIVGCVDKTFGENAAASTRMILAKSGHSCITLAIDILRSAIDLYVNYVAKERTSGCDNALEFLRNCDGKIATVTTDVLKDNDSSCADTPYKTLAC